jgi:hypothetical protein
LQAPSAVSINWEIVTVDVELTFPALPDGRYDAAIHAIDLKRYATVLLCICYRIPHKGRDFFVWEELAIDAPVSSPGYARTAQGKGRIVEILSAFGEQPPVRIFAPDLEDTLVGREVHIAIWNKQSGTFPVPVVTAVLGKARNPVPAPVE